MRSNTRLLSFGAGLQPDPTRFFAAGCLPSGVTGARVLTMSLHSSSFPLPPTNILQRKHILAKRLTLILKCSVRVAAARDEKGP